ncbi:hypothetical protein CHKEEEPN_3060 [Methylorubrum podarium]|nr:hypothetical protein CHKEEEPN_3060 [Methylorubrum podarium]
MIGPPQADGVAVREGVPDDQDALQPHPEIDHDRDDRERPQVEPHAREPQRLRHEAVAEQQAVIEPAVVAGEKVGDHRPVGVIAAVPAHEPLGGVGEGHDDAGEQHHLRHGVEMGRGDHRLKIEAPADDDRQHHHHGETRIHRADDEVGREDRFLPAGHQARGEVEADDGVDRADERHGQRRHGLVEALVDRPVPGRAAPTERQRAVDPLPDARPRPVAHRGEVRQEAGEPEDQREQQVAQDRPEIPDQRRTPLRPEIHGVRIGREPVRVERPPEMDDREDAGDRGGEQGHRLGEAVDRGTPVLARQQQHRGDQRPGIADADPPDVVGDREAPDHRGVHPRKADADGEHRADGDYGDEHQRQHPEDGDDPGTARPASLDRVRDRGADLGVAEALAGDPPMRLVPAAHA